MSRQEAASFPGLGSSLCFQMPVGTQGREGRSRTNGAEPKKSWASKLAAWNETSLSLRDLEGRLPACLPWLPCHGPGEDGSLSCLRPKQDMCKEATSGIGQPGLSGWLLGGKPAGQPWLRAPTCLGRGAACSGAHDAMPFLQPEAWAVLDKGEASMLHKQGWSRTATSTQPW